METQAMTYMEKTMTRRRTREEETILGISERIDQLIAAQGDAAMHDFVHDNVVTDLERLQSALESAIEALGSLRPYDGTSSRYAGDEKDAAAPNVVD